MAVCPPVVQWVLWHQVLQETNLWPGFPSYLCAQSLPEEKVGNGDGDTGLSSPVHLSMATVGEEAWPEKADLCNQAQL